MNFLETVSTNPSVIQSLEIMAFGMTGIFIVLGMLFVSVKVLIKLFPAKAAE